MQGFFHSFLVSTRLHEELSSPFLIRTIYCPTEFYVAVRRPENTLGPIALRGAEEKEFSYPFVRKEVRQQDASNAGLHRGILSSKYPSAIFCWVGFWEQFFSTHQIGGTVKGRVVRHAPFGIFVEIEEGIEGLCHVSELENADAKTKVEDRFAIGDSCDFKIIKLNPVDRKIGLSQRATSEDEERKEYDTYRDAADGSATLADLFHAKNNS